MTISLTDSSRSVRPISDNPTRRHFLKVATGAAAGLAAAPMVAAQEVSLLPTVAFGSHRITRLIAGTNPVIGGAHFNHLLSAMMLEYFTDQQVVKFMLACEKAGINTWQSNYAARFQRQFLMIRDAGCKMHWIYNGDAGDVGVPYPSVGSGFHSQTPMASKQEMLQGAMKAASLASKANPIGIAHHGGFTDHHWRLGSIDLVHDFINHVHDLGFPAGVGTHNPAVIEALGSKGWPIDFYMACFYNCYRTDEAFEKELGVLPVGETYLATDPDRMTKAMRQAKPVCLGFKILAAGRRCESPEEVGQCFDYAFKNIKPTDAVIVGMLPKFSDQIAENVGHVRRAVS
jgi:hypothetical protein